MILKKNAIGGLNLIVLLFFTFFMIYAWASLSSKYAGFGEKIGEKQFELIQTYQKGESALFYIDQSAKYSLQQAVYELAKNGGISEIDVTDSHASATHECGRFNGAYVWYEIRKDDFQISEKECFDGSSSGKSLQFYFNEKLNHYLQDYPETLPLDNYVYEVKGNLNFIGHAIEPLKFDILREQRSRITSLESMPKTPDISTAAEKPRAVRPNIPVSYKYRLDNLKRPAGTTVDRIILHHTGDDAAIKTYNTLLKRGLSVHYIIDRDGTIYYALGEDKIAYHAENWNRRSIGIEIVNTGHENMEYTEQQYVSVKKLVDDISSRWPDIKADNEHVIAHYQASSTGKWDPSPNFNWAKLGLADHVTLVALGKKPPEEFGYT